MVRGDSHLRSQRRQADNHKSYHNTRSRIPHRREAREKSSSSLRCRHTVPVKVGSALVVRVDARPPAHPPRLPRRFLRPTFRHQHQVAPPIPSGNRRAIRKSLSRSQKQLVIADCPLVVNTRLLVRSVLKATFRANDHTTPPPIFRTHTAERQEIALRAYYGLSLQGAGKGRHSDGDER